MYGRAAIVIEVHPRAVVVPVAAAQLTGGTFHAFVVGPPEPAPAGVHPVPRGGASKPAGEKDGRAGGKDGAGPPPGTLARVKRVALEIGVDGGDWLEVTRGLAPGDEIVTAGIDVLSDGSLVRAVKGVDPFTGRAAIEPAAHSRP